ncbi:protein containg diguanylate cyclase (GGDEF) domain [Longilinea arvoryzae]|uniref:Protein containg diguanylate cyclase (GGDEF) domain n=2 Tax=Longilinea arvoryzae TaxID=360412 RepID=A0A0S7BMB6_9CHLR|nr:protein containg diguanylate cyclase (GGDEF) domain [Longilinea arvoryzae]
MNLIDPRLYLQRLHRFILGPTRNRNKFSDFYLMLEDQQRLALPAILLALILCLFLLLSAIWSTQPLIYRQVNTGIGLSGFLYLVLVFFIILPHYGSASRGLRPLFVIVNSGLIIIASIFQSYLFNGFTSIIIILIMVTSAVLTGRYPTYLFVVLTIGIQIALEEKFHIVSFDNSRLIHLFILIFTILVTETITMMRRTITFQYHRLEILNQIAHNLSSSLEMHQVIGLVSNAIQTTLDADTYYLGLLHGNILGLELLYDDGEFFPNVEIRIENSLAGWVISNKRPLLLRNVTTEAREKYGIRLSTVGKPIPSNSWMGVPLETNGRIFGIVAVASYMKNQFNQSDLELLQNVTQQAAMALDNAAHHAEVEDQSRKDTLTGTLNHGAFLKSLARETFEARSSNQSLSLIMLDIDKFKEYNDHYGHLVGDQVLVAICDTIRRHIKNSDLIGRWGGEEFVIALPNASCAQATQIANRIRRAMMEISLFSRDQKPIHAPTISQGIAVFPGDAGETSELIDLADQRLYKAKERGRNQIEPDNIDAMLSSDAYFGTKN